MTSIRQRAWRARSTALVIALLIVVVAGALRIVGFDWDKRRLLHPDERFLVMTTAELSLPANVGEYLDASLSPLNPRRADRPFAYGSLPLAMTRALMFDDGRGPYVAAVRAGRALSIAADLLTLIVLGWWTRRLAGTPAALVAMALYACAVLAIQHAHFFVVEPHLTLWCTVAVAALSVWHRRPGIGAAAATGGAAALAVSCKVSGAVLLVPMAVALASRVVRPDLALVPARTRWRLARHALTCVVAGLVTLRVASPDIFASGWLPWPSSVWLGDLRVLASLMNGATDFPPSFQWANRLRGWYPWWNLVRFGLGVPLGIAATGATAWAAWRVLARWRSRLLVPTVWALTVGALVGSSFVGSMRYLLPIYPTLCLLTAWALTRLVRQARRSPRRSARRLALALTVIVIGSTALWAWAFTAIYRELHPRLAASRWIYDHVPAGSVLTAETWDDALPIAASARTTPERYEILTLPVTDEDTRSKADDFVASLDRADVVVLSSDRAAGTLPRLPRRFPVMTRYYAALDDGRLGFERVATFTASPKLGPFTWADAHAEEAFTVYDHPTVRIYRKTAKWSPTNARALLVDDIDPASLVRTTALQLSTAPQLLELDAAHRAALADEGTWRAHDGRAGRFGVAVSPAVVLMRWLAAVLVVGLLAWPACAVLLPDTWGRGVLVAPALGLLWVSWVVWVYGTIAPWPISWTVLIAAVASLGALSTRLAWGQRHALIAWASSHRRLIAGQAIAWMAVATAGILVRAANPDLWHHTLGGEKPLDIALLSALVRADRFPAFDPWFAGGVLNYYYVGFVPVAVLSRLTGIEPRFAYTLAIGTWWAMTAGGVAIVAGTLVRHLTGVRAAGRRMTVPIAAATAGAIGVVCGNLHQWRLIWQPASAPFGGLSWFWDASRAIPAAAGEAPPITEFPFFTFLFADLHAHLLAMPWLLATALVSLQIVLGVVRSTPERAWLDAHLVRRLMLGGLLLGMLAATNAWDTPTGGVLLVASIGIVAARQLSAFVARRRRNSEQIGPPRAGYGGQTGERLLPRTVVVALGILAGTAVVASAPFWWYFAPPVGGPMLWQGSRTPWLAGLLVQGPFLLVVVPAVVLLAREAPHRRANDVREWLGMALALGLLLLAGVEVLAVRGDVGRMNSVFKVYLQVWLLWSACLPAAWLLVSERLRTSSRLRAGFVAVTAIVGAVMLAYPLTATGPRLRHRMAADAPRGLDGTAFLTHATLGSGDADPFPLNEDAALIRWLLDEVPGTPTIIEAQTEAYQWGARISAHTGLPTVLGWTWHARQQRMALPGSVVARRVRDVRHFYDTPSADEAWVIARRYDIRYVVVGRLEQAQYAAEGLAKFETDERWRLAFTTGRSRIYARVD